MRFADITCISKPQYYIDVPILYLKEELLRYKNKYNLNFNPEFQRGHVWSYQQKIDYMEFLLKEPMSGRDIYFNCPGWMNDFNGPMVIVDGKQRVNTILEFLSNHIPVFKCYYYNFEDHLTEHISLTFHINNMSSYNDIIRWYIDMNTGGTSHTQKEINKAKSLLKQKLLEKRIINTF